MPELSPSERAPRSRTTCTWQLEYGGTKRAFTLFDTPMAHRACEAVLSGKCYPPLPISGQIRTIVDIGANVGAATIYFAMQFPGARVLAFEPAPDSFALLSANTSDLHQIRCFNVGLFDRDQETDLYQGRDDAVEDSIGRSREQSNRAVQVQLRAAREAIQEAGVEGIDLLKMDTEGCEVPILNSLVPVLSNVGVIYIEFHSERDRVEIDRLLMPTHALFCGQIAKPYRGELCYVARQCLPKSIEKEAGISI